MMKAYNIFEGSNPHDANDYDIMALSVDIPVADSPDYFLTSQTEIHRSGRIEIEGNTELCPEYFSIK